MQSKLALSGLGVAALLLFGLPSRAEDLEQLTGTATFDVQFMSSDKPEVTGMAGRRQFTFTRLCDQSVEHDNAQLTVFLSDGGQWTIEIDMTEAEDAKSLTFAYSSKLNGKEVDVASGVAARVDTGIAVHITAPVEQALNLPSDVRLSVEATQDIIRAAMKGERTVELKVFNGPALYGERVFTLRAEIGDARTDDQTEAEKLFARKVGRNDLLRWPVKWTLTAAESGRVLDVSDTLLCANGIQIGMVDYANGYRNRYELVDFQSEPVVPCL